MLQIADGVQVFTDTKNAKTETECIRLINAKIKTKNMLCDGKMQQRMTSNSHTMIIFFP